MKLFTPIYQWTLRQSEHPKAPWVLGGMSAAESVFFPIPPDVLLAPMVLAKPEKTFQFALITTIFSMLGGIVGYLLGVVIWEQLLPLLMEWGYGGKIDTITQWFEEYGLWVLFLAGFSPIPYKLFTLTSGAMAVAFIPFVVVSFVSRGARFFLVAYLMRWGGKRYGEKIETWVEWLGWLVVALVTLYILLRG